MSDLRLNRGTNVVSIPDQLKKDREKNLEGLIEKAKSLNLEGFEKIDWEESIWEIKSGRLIEIVGRNTKVTTISFILPPKLGNKELLKEWNLLAKSLLILRLHRRNQSTSNQRSFITALGYIAYSANQFGLGLIEITPEILDNACLLIARDYSENTAYNLHKAVSEFGRYCDSNKLCNVIFKYKYSKMKRPSSVSGIGYARLDDPSSQSTNNDKLIDISVFEVLGNLYQKVPKKNKYRIYILILVLLLCTGRRISEILYLPFQKKLKKDVNQHIYLEYFPCKSSQGNTQNKRSNLYLLSKTIPLVQDLLDEINELCASPRSTAIEMYKKQDVDLRFLSDISSEVKLYKDDLIKLGIAPSQLDVRGWIRVNNFSKVDLNKVTKKQGIKPANPCQYTSKKGVIAYCRNDYVDKSSVSIYIDQNRNKYHLKDLLLLRYPIIGGNKKKFWQATKFTNSMVTTFIRYLPKLAEEFGTTDINLDFNSHGFRHTINTLLDEGGLSDLMQTEWFGRTNPIDTKAYQHTSPEKRVLMLREDIKKGQIGGQFVEQINSVPVTMQDALINVRINAVHDVGTGFCIHNYSQTPCSRHLQCSADCKDYLWHKDDKGRVEELKRQYALTFTARDEAIRLSQTTKPKKSVDWLAHNEKKLVTLKQQLQDNKVENFNPIKYLTEIDND